MNEYVDFLVASLRECDPQLALRQKEFEERINKPFRLDSPSLFYPQ